MLIAKDFYLLRTPLLPVHFLQQFDELTLPQLGMRLKTVFADPSLQEAIYIASPDLHQELQKWVQDAMIEEKGAKKLVLSLFRYLIRMSSRCTPYGLFAGCALGKLDAATEIKLASPGNHKKHCRLDMNYVAELATMISSMPHIQNQLLYYPNNSLYSIAGKYRYAEYEVKDKFRVYHLSEVSCSGYLKTIIHAATTGATLDVLANTITTPDISKEEALDFVMELVQSQLLVSELEPTVTGDEYFKRLIKRLNTLEDTSSITEVLTRIHQLLQDQTAGTEKYIQAHTLVKELLPQTNSKDLVQTDLFLAVQDNTISSAVMTAIQHQVEKLWTLTPFSDNADLQAFRQAFTKRYEEQEVPLLMALDAEAGIGYASHSGTNADHTPLVDGIIAGKEDETKKIAWSKLQDFQMGKLQDCLKSNAVEIELTDKDLDGLKAAVPSSLPDSLYLIGSLLGNSAAAIEAGDYRFELHGGGGPSAATLLGRFCHGDEALTAKVKDCLREEEQKAPDVIFAEVVHLPEARTGNILLRPQLRPYEIVYLGKSSVAHERQIPLTDLMVRVQGNMVILRSKKLNKRVIPRLSTAHNFRLRSLPAYKFLGDLQFQQLHSGLSWQWNLVREMPFLPRVRYGKIILGKCTWLLQKKDFPELTTKKASGEVNYPVLFKKVQQELRLPQYVVIAEGDNELLLNLGSEPCLHILGQTLVKNERVVLQEFLQTEDNCFVEGEGGRYTNEIILPLRSSVPVKEDSLQNMLPTKATDPMTKNPMLQRTFLPGSEWLYVKIYCGTQSAERLLKEVIRPLTDKLLTKNKIDKWFFLRYADPQHHLRIRFHHATDRDFWKEVQEALHAAMRQDTHTALAYKIQLDTYEREIERYGAEVMEWSEDIFYYDSEAVIQIIDLLEVGEEGEKYRWLLAARGVHMLLDDFDYDLPAKALLLKKLQQGFFTEFGGGKALTSQLNDKYREHMQDIRSFLVEQNDAANGIEEVIALYTLRSIKLKETIHKIITVRQAGAASPHFDQLLSSYIHMFLNRIFLSAQRKHELVIYHFLSKYYDSQVAINKQQLQKV